VNLRVGVTGKQKKTKNSMADALFGPSPHPLF